MDRYPRLFILTSLIYLALGTAMGLLMAVNLLDHSAWRFVHLHLNLLGFMTMMISGVAYHVIPRFTGRPLKRPSLMGLHFWLANVGLVGMVAARGTAAAGGGAWALRPLPLFAAAAAAGAWVFVWNLLPLLRGRPAMAHRGQVHPEMKVADVLARWPSSLEVFKRWGFAALARPAARATFAKLVSIEKACRIHKVDLPPFLAALNGVAGGGDIALPLADAAGACPQRSAGTPAEGRTRVVDGNVLVGDLIRRHPATRAVLERFFGPDCFSCPAQVQETLDESASMHGVDADELLDAIDSAVRGAGTATRSP